MWSHQLYEIALKYYFFLKSFWTLLQFIATAPAVIMAAVLGLGRGLYYAVKIMKALEFSSSLFFLSLDYSVSMDTWLQFPLQSANQRLKTGSRSIAVLWRLYPSRHCFIFVSSSSIMQRRSTAAVFFFFFIRRFQAFIADSDFIVLHLSVTHYQCQRCRWREARWDRLSSLLPAKSFPFWREVGSKRPSGVLVPERKLAAVKASRDPLKAKQTHP